MCTASAAFILLRTHDNSHYLRSAVMHSRIIKSDAAFADVRLQRDAKVGALLACLAGVALPLAIARFFDFSHEDVGVQAKLQLQEELEEARQRMDRITTPLSEPTRVRLKVRTALADDKDGSAVAAAAAAAAAAVVKTKGSNNPAVLRSAIETTG